MKHLTLALFLFVFIQMHAQLNIDSLSHISYQQLHGADLNDVWGYEDELGNEYAIVGTSKGTSIVDISNPSAPVEIFWYPGTESIWRDPSVHGNYAYVTTEAEDGMLIIDLSPLPQSNNLPVTVYSGPPGQTWTSAHTCFCDENGYGYVFGSNRGNGGVIILDLNNNPMQPDEVGVFDNWYCHDGYVRNDTMYLGHIFDGFFSLVDVTSKSNPALIASHNTPSNFTHNIWPSQSGQYVFTTDEVSGAFIGVYDISNPAAIFEVERIQNSPGAGVIPHNTHVLGDYLITSYYSDGIVVHDCTHPNNLVKVGQFDTYVGQTPGFDGCWGVYPFFTSGTIVAADITEGLFVLGPHYQKGSYLEGNVTEVGSNAPLNNVKVTLGTNDQPDFTLANGDYATGVYQTGAVNVLFEKVGYIPFSTSVNLVQGQTTTLDAQLVPMDPYNVLVIVNDAVTGIPIYDAQVQLIHPLISHSGTTNALGEENFTLYYQDNYQVIAGKWGYKNTCSQMMIDSLTGTITLSLQPGYYDDFALDFGWAVNGTAHTGMWERGVPHATSSGSVVNADVPWDCGQKCFVTGNDPNLHPDFDDVDQGNTVLNSPIMDLTGMPTPHFNYGRGFYCYYGPQLVDDTLKVFASNGIETVLIDQVNPPQGTAMNWEYKSVPLAGLLAITPNMQILLTLSDEDPNVNITEAAFDEFYVTNYSVLGNEETSMDIEVFPNPAKNAVNVSGVIPNENCKLFDVFGRLVYQVKPIHSSLQLDLTSLPNGMYSFMQRDRSVRIIKQDQ